MANGYTVAKELNSQLFLEGFAISVHYQSGTYIVKYGQCTNENLTIYRYATYLSRCYVSEWFDSTYDHDSELIIQTYVTGPIREYITSLARAYASAYPDTVAATKYYRPLVRS